MVLNFTSTAKINAMMYATPLAALSVGVAGLSMLVAAGLPVSQIVQAAAGFALLVVFWAAMGIFLRVQVRDAIRSPIKAAAQLSREVAAGDLTARLGAVHSVTDTGETRKLLEGMERMTADLREVVGAAHASARAVADASAQIAQGNLELSHRTEQQAATLEETAGSMEELTATVAQNAENARHASELAAGASQVAHEGGKAMSGMVATMTAITESSRKIGDIVSVIDGIAFQTNLLALNAAVEAARAGDEGRGFAVVAAEVRSLAQHSATAAREIAALIAESVAKVEAGRRQVGSAGETMGKIVQSVERVGQLIAEIAAASREQSSGIGQVNTAVTMMEQVVHQNASLVEEAAATTEAMKDQAAALLQLIARFKLGDDAQPPAPSRGGFSAGFPAGGPAPRH
ncbi:MAG: methyl-accepting chemotaxis protein [Ramlibacter sp.]